MYGTAPKHVACSIGSNEHHQQPIKNCSIMLNHVPRIQHVQAPSAAFRGRTLTEHSKPNPQVPNVAKQASALQARRMEIRCGPAASPRTMKDPTLNPKLYRFCSVGQTWLFGCPDIGWREVAVDGTLAKLCLLSRLCYFDSGVVPVARRKRS